MSKPDENPWTRLCELLREIGATVTFDPARSTALPCIWCHRSDVSRRLYCVQIHAGCMYQEAGRPMCSECAHRTGAKRWPSEAERDVHPDATR